MTPVRAFRLTPWVRRLIVANVVVFFLQVTVFGGDRAAGVMHPFFEFLGFSVGGLTSKPWSVLTYMFVHDGLMHVAFNMLLLFIFGAAVEDRLGSRRFATYYLLCGLGGAGLYILTALMTQNPSAATVVGASGAVYGVALAFAWFWPDAPIFVFPLPVPIKAKWLVAILAAIGLLSAVSSAQTGVAHLAHLGGFLVGLVLLRSWKQAPHRPAIAVERVVPTKVLVHPTARKAETARRSAAKDADQATPRETSEAEVDRVLDKISSRGIESLTPEERRFLDEMSKRMRHGE